LKLEPTPEAALQGPEALRAQDFEAHVRFLADDKQEGRGVGTKGLDASADYIAARFQEAGLKPAGDNDTFFQTFELTVGGKLTAAKDQKLKVAGQTLKLDDAWRPFSFTESGKVQGPLVFAGYGISAPDLGYDDYEGLDVKGKVVLVLRHEPGRLDPNSKFNGADPSRHSDLRYKASLARRKGAAAILVINDPASYANPTEKEPDALYSFHGAAQAGLPAAHLTWKGAQALIRDHLALDLVDLQKRIDATYKPVSVASTKQVELSISVERTQAKVRNVVAVAMPDAAQGPDGGADGVIVVGAHYDHLGWGDDSSLRPGVRAVHNGADDNASGTAMLLELAQAFGPKRNELRRPLYFVAFTAEEIGIRGSEHFVAHAPVPAHKLGAMVNFDMVGRLRDQELLVGGVGTAQEFEALVPQAAEGTGLKVSMSREGFGPSDHSAFYAQKVPVLFFFTGAHEQYHTPEDDADLINYKDMEQIGALAYRSLRWMTRADERPLYTQADVKREGDRGGTGSRSYGAYLGTVPSFAEADHVGGVKLQGVKPGSPAEAAGFQGGDFLVQFNGQEVKNLHDYADLLKEHKPGQTVVVVVMRAGQRVELKATLGKRQ
jgi:hypothetical protein